LDIIVQIESHIKRLDEDLGQFAEDLKHGTRLQATLAAFTHHWGMSSLILFKIDY